MYDFLRIVFPITLLHRRSWAGRHPLRATVAALLALTMVPFLPTVVFAHGDLRRATPGAGDELTVSPRELRLTFTEAIELELTRLVLTGPDGAVSLGPLAVAPDSATVLVGAVEGRLVAGIYTVEWQVVGNDGHPVRGEYSFTISPDADGLAMAEPPAPVASGPEAVPTPASQEAESTGESGADLLVWAIGAVGLGALSLVASRLRSRPEPTEEDA